MPKENKLSYKIIRGPIELLRQIGFGLLESVCENALAYELGELGLNVQQQLPMPFIYKEVKQDVGYRIDLLVNKKVIVEIKSVENLAPVYFSQTLTYLRLADLKLALLIKFNSKLLRACLNFVFRICYGQFFCQSRPEKRSLAVPNGHFYNEEWQKKSHNKTEG